MVFRHPGEILADGGVFKDCKLQIHVCNEVCQMHDMSGVLQVAIVPSKFDQMALTMGTIGIADIGKTFIAYQHEHVGGNAMI